MTDNNNDSQPLSKDFEFNNGIGDALKEKDQYAFSWPKTVGVLFIGSAIIIGGTFGVLEIGKRLFKVNTMQQVVQKDDVSSFDLEQLVDEVNNDEWEVLPMTTSDANPPEASTPASIEPIEKDIAALTDTFKAPVPAQQPKEPIAYQKAPAPVSVKKVMPPSSKPIGVTTKKPTVFRVIAGSFKDFSNAKNQLTALQQKKFDGYIFTEVIDGVMVHRIQAGAFSSQENAEELMSRLAKQNVQSYIIN